MDIKSTAVVKYSAVPNTATFARLQCNTDLNLPPSNWLSSSVESYGLQSVWSQNSGFSSFRMAHMFPDCVGQVDVVSDAENIKKLLKLPYNNGVISMMVHRVENTLLIDDFDVHKYLLRQAESDWEWLKKFFYEHIVQNISSKEKCLPHKGNTRNTLQQRNLISKFLYHSLVVADNDTKNQAPPLPVESLEQSLPEPKQEETVPDPSCNHNFSRNVVWTFENIQMLIGTDMPIFGGGTHPCISLRLRDMSKPINVLTGIDYWLDNLMCNVPEVVMCYHLDGIVQRYELIKTEDLPNLEHSKFSPKVIRDIAQNILSFLKTNATKAGHTYWLFKGKDDDVVKLYDLTSLCLDVADEKGQNPFTVPVAMLLYRVARNMKYSSDYHRHQGTICILLKNCLKLLVREKYPQIVTSAHFMLADLYIPSSTDPSNPKFVDQSDDESTQTSMNDDNDEEEFAAAIKSLTLDSIQERVEQEEIKYKPPPISGTIEERCSMALEHVFHGLECLKYFPNEKIEEACQHPNIARSSEAIPMPYNMDKKEENDRTALKKKSKSRKKKLDKGDKALLCKPQVETVPIWQIPKKHDSTSWNAHLKTLLYEKASLILAVIAEREYLNKNYGGSLRYMSTVLRCQKILEIFCSVKNNKSISYLLGRAGDCCFMIVQDWTNVERHKKEYSNKILIEEKIVEDSRKVEDSDINEAELLPQSLDSLQSTLVASYKCYTKALCFESSDVEKNNLLRRLGNIHNELGVLYMNQAGASYQKEVEPTSVLLKQSLTHLNAGVKAFETVNDQANLALLHSNTGRLMRLCAHMHTKQDNQGREFYDKALASYQSALQILGSRKLNPPIWDTVTWDLSTTLFSMATLLQDYPESRLKTEEELEREVVEILQKALKYCDTETPSSRQPIYQFRAAIIQHRLASLYHRIYREQDPDPENTKRKTSLQLCKLYYEKAGKLLLSLEQSVEFLTVQMERVALAERQATNATAFNGKLKAYQNGLEMILQCYPIIEILFDKCVSKKDEIQTNSEAKKESVEEAPDSNEDESTLIILLEQRLQFILRSITKLFLNKNNQSNKKEFETMANLYKQCYSRTLRSNSLTGISLIQHIAALLKDLRNMLNLGT